MEKSKAEDVRAMINNIVAHSVVSLTESCEEYGITVDDYYEFINHQVNSLVKKAKHGGTESQEGAIMALTMVTINNISTKGYARNMISEFVALMQQGMDGEIEFTGACTVSIPDGMSEEAVATQLRKCIEEQELKDSVKVQVKTENEKKVVYLIDATLV